VFSSPKLYTKFLFQLHS